MKRTLVIAVAVVALVFGLVAYAGAAKSADLTVTAKVGPQMEISLSSPTLDLGTIDPLSSGSGNVIISGHTNKDAQLDASVDAGDFTTLTSGVDTTPVSFTYVSLGSGAFSTSDTITGSIDWSKPADTTLTGTVTYTLSH